jgi:uncharacterized protein (DUF488 family)
MLFSIGTSNRKLAEFLEALERRGVTEIVDVRSRPWSRVPHFNRNQLERAARDRGLEYRWEGETLGGLGAMDPNAPGTVGAVDAIAKACSDQNVAAFCAEGDPTQCHRTYFCGALLLVRHGVVTRSILRDDREEDVTRTLLRVDPKLIPEAIRDETLKTSIRAEAAK